MTSELISVIVPVYNEEGNIGPLLNSIDAAVGPLNYELLVINDGSTDNTSAELSSVSKRYPRLKIIDLKRNFGQTAALAAGIDHARGDIIIPLDGDGQNDPQDIAQLLSKMKEGYDVVSGWRKNRQDAAISRKLPSMVANWLISTVTGVHIHDYGCTLKAYRAPLLKNIRIYGEMHRFLPAWCAWQGGKITEIPVHHHPRTRGKSKYGISRLFKVIIDLSTLKFFSGYLVKPNYLFSGVGLCSLFASFLAAGLAFFDKFGPDKFPTYRIPLLLLAAFLGLTAVFLILMGLIAELLVRLYFQVRNERPYRLADE